MGFGRSHQAEPIGDLVGNEFWHEQVGRESWFGSLVVRQLPAIAAMTEKHFPEQLWFLDEIKRRPEPNVEDGGDVKKQ